jgi:uncharacterized membrane protein
MKQKLPGATGALVCGILSIVLCWVLAGIPALVLAIVALVQAKKAAAADAANPGMYDGLGNAKAGKIMGIIGLILSALAFIYILVVMVLIGGAALSLMPNL